MSSAELTFYRLVPKYSLDLGKEGYMEVMLVWNLSCIFILIPCMMLSADGDVPLV